MGVVAEILDADYLVVGAGAAGMAFTDALVGHADVRVVMVDRRHAVGGHWLDAYPFVRLHQASLFYGVASTRLGSGTLQDVGPEAGLHERATAPEIVAYFDRVRREQLGDRVDFRPLCDYVGGHRFVSRLTGREYDVPGARVVDATYLSPDIPATTPPPFDVTDGAHVVPVNDLVRVDAPAEEYVVVGSGKTATDACVYLLEQGVDPDRIVWVRPRDPWMLNRAVIQPDAAVFIGAGAEIMRSAVGAASPEEMFLRMEEAGVVLRIDPSVTPTMARTPTLAVWELERLRTVERVVRLGHVREVRTGRLLLDEGEAPISANAVVVHCAAEGLHLKPLVPIWGEVITPQPIRVGFPCFGAALAGYAEAVVGNDEEKNRLCPPSPYSNTPADWMRMQVLGYRGMQAANAHPDLKAWAATTTLNPARVTTDQMASPELGRAIERFLQHVEPGVARMAELAHPPV